MSTQNQDSNIDVKIEEPYSTVVPSLEVAHCTALGRGLSRTGDQRGHCGGHDIGGGRSLTFYSEYVRKQELVINTLHIRQ